MNHNREMITALQDLIGRVDSERGIRANWHEVDYESGWEEFVRTAIYGGGLDLSEMGSTWVADFASMNALRPFSLAEVNALGGAGAFPAGLWASGVTADGFVYGIPWMTDVSLVYYRRDLLAEADIDEATAFNGPDQFGRTLGKLHQAEIPCPWVVPTCRSHISLHNLAMWLWYHKADFVDRSGKQVSLNGKKERAALRAYFGLAAYLAPEAQHLSENQSDNLFAQGNAAVTISGPWLMQFCSPEVVAHLGLAIPLGCPYLGGSSLVIWDNALQEREALEWITTLISRRQQLLLPRAAGMLPGRLEAFGQFELAVDTPEVRLTLLDALQRGRALPNVPLWGMIEDRLVKIIASLWDRLQENPGVELDTMFDAELVPAIEHLNLALSNY